MDITDEVSSFMLQVQDCSSFDELEQLRVVAESNPDFQWRLVEGYILLQQKRFDNLLSFLSNLPADFHEISQFWLLFGLVYRSKEGCLDQAIDCYRKALSISPERSDIHYNLANCYFESDSNSAIDHYLECLRIDPNYAHFWHNYGDLLFRLRLFDDSLNAFKVSLRLDPFNSDCVCNLGLAYMALGLYSQAETSFLTAIHIDPGSMQSHLNLGCLLISQRKPEDALNSLNRSIELDLNSNIPDCFFNLGYCHLLLGRFKSGWIHYEQRLFTNLVPLDTHPSSGPLLRALDQLQFDSPSPLLVWAEQGLGDTIQFCRYLHLLDDLGVNYEFYCPKSLVKLILYWLKPSGTIVTLNSNTQVKEHRLHCPLLSLPRLFDTTEDSIPSSLPYLIPPSDPSNHLLVSKQPGALSVGLVWASNPDNKRMYNDKSICLDLLMPILARLIDLGLISLHSLQVGDDRSQLNPWKIHTPLTDWSTKLHDFSDTATICTQLDLVISVDTAVAHLAAALNCPTWTLLPWDADFRWLLDRFDSPWYPRSMRLFRQQIRGDWSGVINDLQLAFDDIFMLNILSLSEYKKSSTLLND